MNKERLLKLADHLETGKLFHREFYFGSYNCGEDYSSMGLKSCGHAGCAIGECPGLFPAEWKWTKHGSPVLVDKDDSIISGAIFFDLSHEEFNLLFNPYRSGDMLVGQKVLDDAATKEQVAANIRAFVAYKEK